MNLERLLRQIAGGSAARRGGHPGQGFGGHGYGGHGSAGHPGTGVPRSGGGIGETIGRMIDQQMSGRRHGKGHAPRAGGGDLAGLLRRFGGRRY